jgi:DNA-binding CsgD family transcriptional regulator
VGDAVIVGRDEELAAVAAVVGADRFPLALVIEGEPGIGKTTLWQAAVERAERGAFRILACRPAETETPLSFAGLGDLLVDAFDEVDSELPAPQAHGVAVALRRREPGAEPPDQLAIRSGVLGLIRALARHSPVVVAVDDVQWLDRSTALALEFVLRRLRDGDKVVFVVALRRNKDTSELPLGLDRAGSVLHVMRLDVGPLSLGAVHGLLRTRLGTPIPRPVLRKIHETSAGNPFYALELGRELVRHGLELGADERIPLPPSLDVLVRRRLTRLSPDTRSVLLGVSALARPSVDLLAAAYGSEQTAHALDEAVESGVIEQAPGRVRFSHPLLASSCYASANRERLRHTHGVLATVVHDPEERARHLALAVDGHDAEIAAGLEAAARHAAARGASSAAAELAEFAVAYTPPRDEVALVRRRLEAGDQHLRSGDATRARARYRQALAPAPPGPPSAAVLIRLAETETRLDLAIELADEALAGAADDAALASRIHCFLGFARSANAPPDQGLEHARRAVELAELAGDDALLVSALTQRAEREYVHGHVEVAVALLDRALALEKRVSVRLFHSPRITQARGFEHLDRYGEARALYVELLGDAEEQGDEWARLRILWNLAELEVSAGRFEAALGNANAGLELAEAADLNVQRFLFAQGESAAYLGRVEEARAALAKCLEFGERTKSRDLERSAHALLGFLELSLGDAESAAELLRALPAALVSEGGLAPEADVWATPIEALVGVGELELADEYTSRYEELAGLYGVPRELAAAARCRALLHGARGELDEALSACEAALAEHARSQSPFERARTLVVYGATLRRAKRRGEAREVLHEALAEFERLSTPLWAETARAELARVGGRRRASGLTETERRIAGLVAEGRSNKEIAAALYVTPKTVETRLTRMYAKLGVHSRAELARRVFEGQRVGIS